MTSEAVLRIRCLPHRWKMSLCFQKTTPPRNLPTTQLMEEVGGGVPRAKAWFTTWLFDLLLRHVTGTSENEKCKADRFIGCQKTDQQKAA